jgi:hypothetical protein
MTGGIKLQIKNGIWSSLDIFLWIPGTTGGIYSTEKVSYRLMKSIPSPGGKVNARNPF